MVMFKNHVTDINHTTDECINFKNHRQIRHVQKSRLKNNVLVSNLNHPSVKLM